MKKQFNSPNEFRQSLQNRLTNIARKENEFPQEIMKRVAFDRFLARFFAYSESPWYLKGGYSLELRFPNSRSTRDIDLVLRGEMPRAANETGEIDIIENYLFKYTQLKLDDYFEFIPSREAISLDSTPYGGKRYNIECRIAGKRFISFHVDISLNDISQEPLHESIEGKNWLEFAGITPGKFKVLCTEEIFAEKLHAYTLPRDRPNSRVRDLVDMVMLIKSEKIDAKSLSDCVNKVFRRRKTHGIPTELQMPPENWETRFHKLAEECSLKINTNQAFDQVQEFLVENKIIQNKTKNQEVQESKSSGIKI